MSCLSGLFSCCLPTSSSSNSPTTPSAPHPQVTTNTNSSPLNPDLLPPPDDGYSQVTPLPRYTPRPMSIQEKTLEAHMRDPPISSAQYHASEAVDEKQRLAWEEGSAPDYYRHHHYHHYHNEEVTSDVSSAISFPSSYGNTSTATRETPPPPYSPPILSPAPSRSMSISSAYRPNPLTIAPPPPVFQRPEACARGGQFISPRRSIDEQLASQPRRFSWESH